MGPAGDTTRPGSESAGPVGWVHTPDGWRQTADLPGFRSPLGGIFRVRWLGPGTGRDAAWPLGCVCRRGDWSELARHGKICSSRQKESVCVCCCSGSPDGWIGNGCDVGPGKFGPPAGILWLVELDGCLAGDKFSLVPEFLNGEGLTRPGLEFWIEVVLVVRPL